MLVKLVDGRAAEIRQEWREPTVWNGKAKVGRYCREEYRQANLGLTESGLWVILPSSGWQGERPEPYEITAEKAAGWFAACEIELPEPLRGVVI